MKVKNMSQDERVLFFTTEPIPRLILKMSVPTVISMLVTSFYNMADTLFVGRLDTQSTAAVGVSFSIMAFIQAMGFFFGHGSGNYISRKLGAREYEDAERMAATGFFSAFVCGNDFWHTGIYICGSHIEDSRFNTYNTSVYQTISWNNIFGSTIYYVFLRG